MSSVYEHCSGLLLTCCPRVSGVCGQGATPSVSSINRILRNRAAERAASEYAHHATAFPFFPPFGFPPPALQLWSGWAGRQRLIGGGCSDRMESEDEADQKSPQASTPGRYNLLFNFEDLLFLSWSFLLCIRFEPVSVLPVPKYAKSHLLKMIKEKFSSFL